MSIRLCTLWLYAPHCHDESSYIESQQEMNPVHVRGGQLVSFWEKKQTIYNRYCQSQGSNPIPVARSSWRVNSLRPRLTSIGLDNGLSPDRRQAIIWTNAGLLLIGTKPQWNFNRDFYIIIQENVFEIVVWKMAAILSRAFSLPENGLMRLLGSNPSHASGRQFVSRLSIRNHFLFSRTIQIKNRICIIMPACRSFISPFPSRWSTFKPLISLIPHNRDVQTLFCIADIPTFLYAKLCYRTPLNMNMVFQCIGISIKKIRQSCETVLF